ncbi:MAG: hypothetical protein AAFQ54_10595 [Pseudomonadota bacterium]
MCISLEALALFLTLVGSDLVTTEPGRITVHATATDAHWTPNAEDLWCTGAPQEDAAARLKKTSLR